MTPVNAAVVAAPATLLVLSSVAGATAQITQANRTAVERSIVLTGGFLILAAISTKNVGVIVATAVAGVGTAYAYKSFVLKEG